MFMFLLFNIRVCSIRDFHHEQYSRMHSWMSNLIGLLAISLHMIVTADHLTQYIVRAIVDTVVRPREPIVHDENHVLNTLEYCIEGT